MAAFVLDAMPVSAAFQKALWNDIVVQHPELWFGLQFLIMDDPICNEFREDNARPHVANTVRNFCSAQYMQLLNWPAYSPDISPIEHVWDLVGRHFTRDPRPAASKGELLVRIHAIWNSLLQVGIQNLFDSMPRCIASLIGAHGRYTKY
ncbi:hypothetical protein TNCV_1855431 [Trichonephila clavipes]|nr:hypothetical protein TNCV_1855431 [Trichonephila clavipes]